MIPMVVLNEEELRERQLRKKREWHAKNRQKNNARAKASYLANKDERLRKMAEWRKANKDKIRQTNLAYRQANKTKIAASKDRWRRKNRAKVQASQTRYAAKKLKTDPVFCLKNRMRVRMCQAMRSSGVHKSDRTLSLIGCTSMQLKKHIESKFLPGMTWENRDRWHVDHIVPIAAFDISTTEGQKSAFHYTNLQPLWAEDNLRKQAKPPVKQRRFPFGYVVLADERKNRARKGSSARKGDVPNPQPSGPV